MDSIRVFVVFALATAAVASVYDLRTGKIPNALSLGVLAVAPLAHFAAATATQGLGSGVSALGWSVAGALICGAIPWLCWRAGTFGGGDVKLLAAIGALCLPRAGMTIEFYSMVVGSVFVMGKLAWNGALFRTLVRSLRVALNPLLPKRLRKDVPAEAMTPLTFAPAILGATVVCFALVHR